MGKGLMPLESSQPPLALIHLPRQVHPQPVLAQQQLAMEPMLLPPIQPASLEIHWPLGIAPQPLAPFQQQSSTPVRLLVIKPMLRTEISCLWRIQQFNRQCHSCGRLRVPSNIESNNSYRWLCQCQWQCSNSYWLQLHLLWLASNGCWNPRQQLWKSVDSNWLRR